MNLLSNKDIVNISYTNIFYSFSPLPKYINLLDKLENIQYNGIRIPRIPSDKNNFLNLEKLLYGSVEYNNLKEESNDDLYKIIKNNFNKIENLNFIKDKKNYELINNINKNDQLKNERYLLKRNNIFYNNTFSNNILKENDKNIDLVPPKKFISIVNNYNSNNFTNIVDLINKNKYNDINKIIINNINNIVILTNPSFEETNKDILNIKTSHNNISSYIKPLKININNEIKPKISDYFNHFQNIYNMDYDLFSSSSSINSGLNKIKNPKIFFKVNTLSSKDNKGNENEKRLISKRGRKQTKFSQKIHSASDDDNIIRKIQVHFLSFLTNYVNDIIRVFIEDNNLPLFKNIDYKIKKNVKYKNVQELKSKTIGEIIQLRVSPKMKNHDDSVNKNIYNKVCSLSPFMYFYLQRSYLSLFKEYFYNKNKVFTVNGKIIPLSIKTRCFTDLINKNYSYKEKLKYVAVNYFLNNHTRYKK